MNTLMLVLRLIHILSGVFWVGSSLVLAFFVSPAVAGAAEAGQRFMAQLMIKTRIYAAVMGAAILTVLAGGSMYWIDSQGLTSPWTTSSAGTGFGIGALFALVGLAFGSLVGRNLLTLGRIAAEISGKPTDAQLASIGAARRQLSYAGPITNVALILALACMATARYWRF